MIVAIGEVVWDIFPEGRVLGGAPVNVAYHLSCLGREVLVVTRVGSDSLAEEVLERLRRLGLDRAGVQCDPDLPTGQVLVTIGPDQEPGFEIVTPAAWDNIQTEAAEELIGNRPFALVFGTLAQRDARSRATIRKLRGLAAQRFYDVNLRPPFATPALVLESLQGAEVVKMNSSELRTIAGWHQDHDQDLASAGDKKKTAQKLASRYNMAALVITEGAAGAWLVAGKAYYEQPGEPVVVADTVGAGDAFFAAFIHGYLAGQAWPACLAAANRRGSYVAAKSGATPPMTDFV